MPTSRHPIAVAVEVVGWLGLVAAGAVGSWIVVATAEVCQALPPPTSTHGGCGFDIAAATIALVVVAVVAVASLAFVIGGRWWRRRPDRRAAHTDPPPDWWYDPRP